MFLSKNASYTLFYICLYKSNILNHLVKVPLIFVIVTSAFYTVLKLEAVAVVFLFDQNITYNIQHLIPLWYSLSLFIFFNRIILQEAEGGGVLPMDVVSSQLNLNEDNSNQSNQSN
mgnify:CR=1 FL=1